MASDKEIPGENFNTEDFIIEIEKWPAVWDFNHEDYNNKNAKKNAWESVIGKFVPNFTNMSIAEKNSIVSSYQRKWKSLRDSYSRERSKQKEEKEETKLGYAAKYRKKYMFFEQLKFLETATKPTEDSPAVSDEEANGEEGTRMEEGIENPKNDEKQGKAREKKRRNKADQDEEFLEILKAKYCRKETGESNDHDKLFLLSLHHDLKTLPDHMKLNVKSQMIGVLSSAKQAAYAFTSPAVHQFSSSSYQYQLPSPAYPHQPPPQSSYQQQPMFNRPFTVPPYQGNEKNQKALQHHDRSYYPSAQSPDETTSNTSDVSNDISNDLFS